MSLDTTQNAFGWTQAGPVAGAYGDGRGPIVVCVGPTGGGKTTESARRTVRIALWQHPSPRDGIRKARIVVLAPTYRKLWDQVIPSYKKVITWWKPGWKGGTGEPAEHIYDFEYRDPLTGNAFKCHVEVLFRAPGDGDLEEFFRGLEATAFWFPEMDTHETEDMLSLASNRVGRYPEPDDRPDDPNLPTAYAGIYGDANAPRIGSWFHTRFFLKRRPSDSLYLQPPGFDEGSPDGFHPQAENQVNLRKISRTYYRDRAATHEEHDVERLLKNRPGYSRHGKPVHPLFNALTMASAEGFEPDPHLPVVIGMDAGSNTLRHAAVFLQRTWGGQTRCLGEFAPDEQTDIVEASAAIKAIAETRFAACSSFEIVVDPAARGQSAAKRGISWVQMIQQMTGFPVRPAPSNDPSLRRGAVDQLLKKQAAPGVPAFMISAPHCPKYMAAMSGEYRFKRSGDKVSEIPDKGPASHVAEAGHYGAMGLNGCGPLGGDNSARSGWAEDADMAAILPD
ncbi:hypothetical protein [Brevundimonas sp.]|uniref:hypothetical protein n=1 Tax=Brevundimonas sp. TaxID=1871086 RepID=UPI0028979823|nr:hypothetical protein [Brevundimonas sp.]